MSNKWAIASSPGTVFMVNMTKATAGAIMRSDFLLSFMCGFHFIFVSYRTPDSILGMVRV